MKEGKKLQKAIELKEKVLLSKKLVKELGYSTDGC